MKYQLRIAEHFVKKWGLESDIVDFDVIKRLIKFQDQHELKIAPHLNADMLEVGSYAAMNVGTAVKLSSEQTAAAVEVMVDKQEGGFTKKDLATAKFCSMVGRWYAYMSGRQPSNAFLKNNPAKNAEIIEFLKEFMEFFATMKITPRQKEMWLLQRTVLLATASVISVKERLIDQDDIDMFMPARTLGDSIENVHTQVRKIDAYPTAVKYLKIVKSIFITQLLKTTGGSYDFDDSTEYLTDFENLKQLEQEKNEEESAWEDYHHFVEAKFEPGNWAENTSLSHAFGYILFKVINPITKKKKQGKKCHDCLAVWVQTDGDAQVENSLTIAKEFSPGKLNKPSVLGNEVVRTIEALFIANREELLQKKGLLKYFVTNVLDKIVEKYPDLPKCHLKQIVKRFLFARFHFWAERMSQKLIEQNEKDIKSEACASRTTKAKVAKELQ